MIVWVKDLVTGNKWILDHDKNKPVYKDGEKLMFSLEQISNYRFYPYDPDAGIFKIDSERHSNIVQETGQYENIIENIIQLRKEYAENKISANEAWSLTLELLNNYED